MKRFLPLLILVCVVNSVVADGFVIPPTAFPTEITIPDQRALIQFANGTERLVIETRFTGAGTNFCWVVPLPSEPTIEAATTGIFPTLQFLLHPKLIHNRTALFPAFTAGLILIYLLVILRSNAAPAYLLPPAFVVVALAFYSGPFAFIAFLLVGWTLHRLRGGGTTLLTLLFLILSALFLGAMLFPTLGGAGSAAGFSEVSETSHGQIGAFDVTTVDSKNPQALFDWLRQNGFEAPAGSKAVVEDYVKEGWVFAVAKLHRENAGSATNAIHPLSFTFKTTKPIYPMRLTGMGTDALKVDLYVVGNERAAARHFKVQQCAPVVMASTSTSRSQANELPLAHPLLKEWLHGSPVVTKLSADLSRSDMKQDVQIDWEPFSPYRPTVYSPKGAATLAADWATGIMLAGLLAGILFFTVREHLPSLPKAIVQLLAVGAGAFLICFLVLPKTPVRITKGLPMLQMEYQIKYLGMSVIMEWDKSKPSNLAEARNIAANVATKLESKDNLLLGGTIREEDSPGNYVIRQGTNGFEFVWFNRYGSEASVK